MKEIEEELQVHTPVEDSLGPSSLDNCKHMPTILTLKVYEHKIGASLWRDQESINTCRRLHVSTHSSQESTNNSLLLSVIRSCLEEIRLQANMRVIHDAIFSNFCYMLVMAWGEVCQTVKLKFLKTWANHWRMTAFQQPD